jgi:putative ABC transport system substrate-binding protein
VHYRIPATYHAREFVEAGGLMSYGTNRADMYSQVGVYCGQILKGAKPAEQPVVQSSKFEFVINAQTAAREEDRGQGRLNGSRAPC